MSDEDANSGDETRLDPAELRTEWWQSLLVWDDQDPSNDVDLDRSLRTLPKFDVSLANEVVKWHGQRFFSVVSSGTKHLFRWWSGSTWAEDMGEVRINGLCGEAWEALEFALNRIDRTVSILAQNKADEAAASGLGAGEQAAAKERVRKHWAGRLREHQTFYKRLGSDAGHRALVNRLAVHGERARPVTDFDTVPEFMVLSNGVLDLSGVSDALDSGRTVMPMIELMDHAPWRMVTQEVAGVEYKPEVGVGPLWAGYVTDVLPDADIRWYFQKALGSTLLGKPRDKILLELIGPRDSGKTLMLKVLSATLGDYATQAPPAVFLKRRTERDADGASPGMHVLRNRKLVVTSEPNDGQAFDGEVIKSITGREKLSTRALHQMPTEWVPRFMLLIACNSPVRLDVADVAQIMRVVPIPFTRVFRRPDPLKMETWESIPPDERADVTLEDRILTSSIELSGVLNWLLEGLRGYVAEGLVEPRAISMVRQSLVEGQSNAVAWLEDQIRSGRVLELPPGHVKYASIGVKELHDIYQAEVGDVEAVSQRAFKAQVGERGRSHSGRITRVRPSGGRLDEDVFDKLFWSDWKIRHSVP
jgi:phage/plasmid-associated DNA primase